MKLQTAPLILLPLLAHSAAIASRDVPAGPWAAGAWRPAPDDPIFFVGDILNAAGGHFWLHQNTTAYCPSEVEGIDCSAYSNNTAFLGGNDTVALYTGVPGGQQGKSCGLAGNGFVVLLRTQLHGGVQAGLTLYPL